MEQMQDLHAGWRPDVYRAGATVLTPDYFGELVMPGRCWYTKKKALSPALSSSGSGRRAAP